jgi:hypothetical protein
VSITTDPSSSTDQLPWALAHSLDGGDVFQNYATFHTFRITGAFVPGINTFDFVATDLGGVGGLNVNRLVGTALSAVPEPPSLVLG